MFAFLNVCLQDLNVCVTKEIDVQKNKLTLRNIRWSKSVTTCPGLQCVSRLVFLQGDENMFSLNCWREMVSKLHRYSSHCQQFQARSWKRIAYKNRIANYSERGSLYSDWKWINSATLTWARHLKCSTDNNLQTYKIINLICRSVTSRVYSSLNGLIKL